MGKDVPGARECGEMGAIARGYLLVTPEEARMAVGLKRSGLTYEEVALKINEEFYSGNVVRTRDSISGMMRRSRASSLG
ncbi:MAG: hypothetical protein KAJ18_10585 [Candidatus Omnitrophica bacterium]|nr:hypothetical protein [Candidatus Omnitrophota bacterium]